MIKEKVKRNGARNKKERRKGKINSKNNEYSPELITKYICLWLLETSCLRSTPIIGEHVHEG